MPDLLALRVLEDRDDLHLPAGTVYASHLLAPNLRGSIVPAAYEAALDHLRHKVADGVRDHHGRQVTADDVKLAEVSADEIRAAWREHTPMDPEPLPLAVLVGYWTPPRKDTRP